MAAPTKSMVRYAESLGWTGADAEAIAGEIQEHCEDVAAGLESGVGYMVTHAGHCAAYRVHTDGSVTPR